MAKPHTHQRPGEHLCGLAKWHPAWMQRFANTKMFMAVYGLLGTIQAMSYMYFVVTLTTLERRFKIPSQTTGLILSGNEISQIMLSLILSYIGGQRNRPRWIAWGVVFCGLSCYILALPHYIYGGGDDALHLTKEYLEEQNIKANLTSTMSLVNSTINQSQHLCGATKSEEECESLITIVPLILIFMSQFVLGIGNTLYYSLGQTYIDDNTKKTNTPLMLSMAMALRMIGPIFGFVIGYVSLNMYIDPTKTPIIDNKDPRWLGAWWLGWMVMGTLMVLFSGLIGLFPKQLPKKQAEPRNSHLPQVLRHEELIIDETPPLGRGFSSNVALDTPSPETTDLPTMKDFPKALMRLLRNKLLIYNNISGIFYILGASGYMTFLSKYMEIQFHQTAQTSTVVVGPVSIIGMVAGLLGSGLIISKLKPSPSKVLFWNVIVGLIYVIGQLIYMFLYCADTIAVLPNGMPDLVATCNNNCSCEGVQYSPVCHEPTGTSYFSACHAGCHSWNSEHKLYSDCSCLSANFSNDSLTNSSSLYADLPAEAKNIVPNIFNLSLTTPFSELVTSPTTLDIKVPDLTSFKEQDILSRSRRSMEALSNVIKPGVCLKDCALYFWSFAITSTVINWFGSSGRIGNILVNYRSVATQDKSFAQGLTLMMISLFALIPGPIIFGRIIDSTCLIWTKNCNGQGNCQFYDQTSFRLLVNGVAMVLTLLGFIFDVLVWYHGRHLDLYGEKEAQRIEERNRKNKAISPLLAKNT